MVQERTKSSLRRCGRASFMWLYCFGFAFEKSIRTCWPGMNVVGRSVGREKVNEKMLRVMGVMCERVTGVEEGSRERGWREASLFRYRTGGL